MEAAELLPAQLAENPDARRYLSGLLSKSLPKLEKEKAMLTAEESAADKKLDAQAIEQSKVCFHCSLSLTGIKAQCSSFLSESVCASSTLDSALASLRSADGAQVLWHLQHLKAVKNQQAALSEILEIPTMLHTLHTAGMFEEMLRLLKYAESLQRVCSSPLISQLISDAQGYQRLLESSVQAELATTLDDARSQKALRLIEELIGTADRQLCRLYLTQRLAYLKQKTDVKVTPTAYLCNYAATLLEVVNTLRRDQQRFPQDCERLFALFLFDRVGEALDLYREKLPQVDRISDLKSIYNALNTLNDQALSPCGMGLSSELSSLIISSTCVKIADYSHRIQANFENMLRLYQWDNSGQRENPILKFGGIAVLYNNCVYLINEVRQFRLAETEAVFCEEMGKLFLSVVNYIMQRGQHLRGAGPRTPQQNVYRGLFFEFIAILRQHALPPLMSAIRDTFPNSAVRQKFVIPTQDAALEALQEVDTSN